VYGFDGYHIDHTAGADDNRIENGRILCIGCHKETPTYGIGLRALLDTLGKAPVPDTADCKRDPVR
jgi:hypothetical protein